MALTVLNYLAWLVSVIIVILIATKFIFHNVRNDDIVFFMIVFVSLKISALIYERNNGKPKG